VRDWLLVLLLLLLGWWLVVLLGRLGAGLLSVRSRA
jgi:hypothetical protein